MRIVIINSLYTPHIIGGAEISTQILAEALTEAADVHVLTLGGQKRKAGTVTERIRGVTVHRLPYAGLYWIGEGKKRSLAARTLRRLSDLYNPVQIGAVKERLETIRPDVIHTQNLSGFGAAVWTAGESLGIPIAHTLRDYSLLSPVSSPLANRALAKLYSLTSAGFSRKVSAVVGISTHILKRHTNAGLFPAAESRVIPNAVDGDIVAAERIGAHRPLRIGCFGRVEPEKGVREFVEAALPLPPDAVEQVVVCGEGSLLEELRTLCRDDPRFVFPGKVKPEEARALMADMDANFVPSIWEEPFGRVIIESYQVGTPVYASAVGGIPDAVWSPDEFLFRPGSAVAIRAKIMEFCDKTAEERRLLQEQCIRHCRKFTQASLLESHLELYGGLLAGRREWPANVVITGGHRVRAGE
ncbi:glycosyltransferase family 4 protein [Cohnella fermenti]|nr:glycosyltransferase family 4 protein [Cohnella fermenti]